MQTLLITGGAGFIGSHTCLVLLESGFHLIIIDSFVNSSKESLLRVLSILKVNYPEVENNIQIIKGDIRDKKLLEEIFINAKNNNRPIDAVIHFAGLKSVNESVNNPLLYWNVNLGGTIYLLEVMKKNNCKTIVFSSSATIYGLCNSENIKESESIKPINPYGQTKASVERLLNDIFNSNKGEWRIASLRYFNPVGAHSSGLIGESPIGKPSNLFPNIANVASKKEAYLKIFGNNWPTPDGTAIRDYIHVMDLADGHKETIYYLLSNGPQYLTLNIGNGRGTSVLEFLKIFEDVNDCVIPYKIWEKREGDVPRSVACNKLVKKLFNWEPKRSISEICKDGWKWQILNPKGYY